MMINARHQIVWAWPNNYPMTLFSNATTFSLFYIRHELVYPMTGWRYRDRVISHCFREGAI